MSQLTQEPTSAYLWQRPASGDKLTCTLCPRQCTLAPGQRGFCFIRAREGEKIVNTSYGIASGVAIDPIEKKPLYHFLPGSPILSLGTLGCNMGCLFCQNSHLSKNRAPQELGVPLPPRQVVALAQRYACPSIAYTYNDPVIWADYALDCAHLAREAGIYSVAVSAGFINPQPRAQLFEAMRGANIDLKSFNPAFYKRYCQADLEVVLETLRYIRRQTSCWLEVTTLIIPTLNDSPEEIKALTRWIRDELGAHTPLHLSAFHPAYKLKDLPPTPAQTLISARQLALEEGLHYVYTGNIHDPGGQTTFCAKCGQALIERSLGGISLPGLKGEGICSQCATPLPGVWS